MSDTAKQAGNENFAVAMPTKQFFVSMLTRDINLADAILDLVDNCLDGALRVAKGQDVTYSKHYVKITLNADGFCITDNCGGISRSVAKDYAFKMGREVDDNRDEDSQTIGMYGVGMKRAIFKMGNNALVRTRFDNDTYEVPITAAWLESKGWQSLPIIDSSPDNALQEPGTTISVTGLYPGVAKHFTNLAFVDELRKSIAAHFTMFLQRGLQVFVNGDRVEPVRVEVLITSGQTGPAPYVFDKEIDGVRVSITVGLNTGKGSSSDDDDTPDFEGDRAATTAGWSVFCNDRAVIVGDKSRLTGWGDGIPMYHPQFSVLTGIIEFRSNNAEKLPVTTTKRALDTSSDIWLQSLIKMREGMRIWVDYTNQWKNHPRSDQTVHWEDATPLPLREVVRQVAVWDKVQKSDGSIEYNPKKSGKLPMPATMKPSSKKVVFSRPIEEIRIVSKELFDSFDTKPGIIGEKCFDIVLDGIRSKSKDQ